MSAPNLVLVATDVMTYQHLFLFYLRFLLEDDGDRDFLLIRGVTGALALNLLDNTLDDRFCLLSVTELISTRLFSIPRSVHHRLNAVFASSRISSS